MSQDPEKAASSPASNPTTSLAKPSAQRARRPKPSAAQGSLVTHILQIVLGLALVGLGSIWMNGTNRPLAIFLVVGGIVIIVGAYMKIGSANEIET